MHDNSVSLESVCSLSWEVLNEKVAQPADLFGGQAVGGLTASTRRQSGALLSRQSFPWILGARPF